MKKQLDINEVVKLLLYDKYLSEFIAKNLILKNHESTRT